MRATRLHRLVQFDIRQFGAPDNPLLGLDRQRVPGRHVVQVFLHQHIAARGKQRVFIADHREVGSLATDRVFGAIDKADDAAHIEIAKALNFIDDRDRVSKGREQLRGQLEAQVHLLGANVQQDVARRCQRSTSFAAELAKPVQRSRARAAEQGVPGTGAKATDAR
ncbi:hypothetical protein D3C81_1675220 [compost metagenome]